MNRNRKRNIVMSLLICATAAAKAWDSSENQIWLEGSVSGNIYEKLSLKLTEQIRYKEEGDLYCYNHTDLCLAYRFSKAWKLTTGFRHISTRGSRTKPWTDKEMYHLNQINKVTLFNRIDFQSRLRLCYTEADNTTCLADVRPEFCITPAKGFTAWKIKPYLSDEIMYNLNEAHLYRNRVNTGIMLAPVKALSLKLFIMHENTQKTKEADFNENFNYGLFANYSF
jgi:hypothetical protein